MPSPLRPRRSRYSPPRPWAPMTDAEWDALAPFLRPAGSRGRPIEGGARARLDAVFRIVSGKLPWGAEADTLSRQFRRWAASGLFARLLKTVARSRRARSVPEALRGLEHWICAAHRRSVRVCGVGAIALARRLGMLSALPGPPWMLPDPVLSERLGRIMRDWAQTLPRQRPAPLDLALARRLLRTFGGARRIHPGLVPA
ncbi:MAG: transposase [Acetobacteraceae bacterium]|nr:transposase [Acetobacteraceae bacterium]